MKLGGSAFVGNWGKIVQELYLPLARSGLVCLWVSFGAGAQGNILTYGSFENSNGTFSANEGAGIMQLTGGYVDDGIVPGWSVIGGLSSLGHPDGIAWESNDNLNGLKASDGSYFLNLAGYDGSSHRGGVTMTQPISTVVGQSYRLSFDLGSCSAAAGDVVNPLVKVGISGVLGAYFSGDNTVGPASGIVSVWNTETITFTANSTATFISFNNCTSLRDNDFFVGLDNITVTAVPEPGTWLGGILSLVFVLRGGYAKRVKYVL